jgi:hypothetical protein
MSDIRTVVDSEAQRAFRAMLDNHIRTRAWNPTLVATYESAERSLDELSDPELDALFEATQADLEDLRVLGDIPLAVIPLAWTPAEAVLPESELRALFGDR